MPGNALHFRWKSLVYIVVSFRPLCAIVKKELKFCEPAKQAVSLDTRTISQRIADKYRSLISWTNREVQKYGGKLDGGAKVSSEIGTALEWNCILSLITDPNPHATTLRHAVTGTQIDRPGNICRTTTEAVIL